MAENDKVVGEVRVIIPPPDIRGKQFVEEQGIYF
jgi:hypothetical protein